MREIPEGEILDFQRVRVVEIERTGDAMQLTLRIQIEQSPRGDRDLRNVGTLWTDAFATPCDRLMSFTATFQRNEQREEGVGQ